MRSAQRCRLLADKIRKFYAAGLHMDADVWHYMVSTVADLSSASLVAMFTDGGDSEAASLIELVFFPDERVQLRLEGLLDAESFDARDETTVVENLVEQRPRTRLFLPDGRPAIKVVVPACAIAPFVQRLRITWRCHPRLLAAIDTFVEPDNRASVKVRLRNRRLLQTAAEIEFLKEFFDKADALAPDFLDCFDFVLNFMGECQGETNYHGALLAKKWQYVRYLQQARQFEKVLERSNMETLMLRGTRAPQIGTIQARETIDRIDRILLIVFGIGT